MSNTSQTAKQTAKEDAKPTGPAGIPNVKPVGVKPRLSDEERAKVAAQSIADHERLLTARTQQVVNLLKDMGIASLAGRIGSYTDLSPEFVEASLMAIDERVAACRAALASRSAKAPSVQKVDLRALANKLAAQRHGVPAGQ